MLRFSSLLVLSLVGLIATSFCPAAELFAQNGTDTSADRAHIVMLIAEREYQTEETLPKFAEEHLGDRYKTTFVFADADDRNRFDGMEAVADADLLVVSVRRRAIPPEQLQLIREHVAAGKPVIGIRTASHAFSLRDSPAPQGRAVWKDWDRVVFGGNYTNHHGNSLQTTVRVVDPSHPITRELELGESAEGDHSFEAGGSLYRVSPLAERTHVLLEGSVPGHPAQPVAWTFTRADGGKSFYTSLGHVEDFAGNLFPQLLSSAIHWVLQHPSPD